MFYISFSLELLMKTTNFESVQTLLELFNEETRKRNQQIQSYSFDMDKNNFLTFYLPETSSASTVIGIELELNYKPLLKEVSYEHIHLEHIPSPHNIYRNLEKSCSLLIKPSLIVGYCPAEGTTGDDKTVFNAKIKDNLVNKFTFNPRYKTLPLERELIDLENERTIKKALEIAFTLYDDPHFESFKR